MIPLGPEFLIPAAAAGGGAAYLRRRYRTIPDLPISIRPPDLSGVPEGVFPLGVYQHTPAHPARWSWRTRSRELLQACWRPWDGGEQHIEVLGTTNAGKTETGGMLVETVAGWSGWDLFVGDGMGGNDFTYVLDSGLGVVCSTDASISTMLAEAVREIRRRLERLRDVRVPLTDSNGVMRAVPPKNVRQLTRAQRDEFGVRPRLYVLDELPALLMREKQRGQAKITRRKDESDEAYAARRRANRIPILEHLMEFAATGRKVGMHIAALAQRADADLLDGFTGNLFRARVLVGSTDQVAESMAHSGQAAVWRELAAATGYEADGLERALRPAGRALVSGLERRPAALVQLYHFDSLTRNTPWSDYTVPQLPAAPAPTLPDPSAPEASPASIPADARPVLPPFGPPGPARPPTRSEAPGATATLPALAAELPPLPVDPPVRPRGRLGRFLARRVLSLGVWRWVLVPSVTPGPRMAGLRARVAEHYGDVCSCCRASGRWEAAHRRARRLRGRDELKNMMPLCVECHDVMTKAENHMIAWRRRPWIVARRMVLGAWSARSRIPRRAWVYVAGACFATGLVTDRWAMQALLLAVGLTVGLALFQIWLFTKVKGAGQLVEIHATRSAAQTIARHERARARGGRGTFMDAKADASAAVEYGWATLKTGVVGMSLAYLAGVYGPGLLAAWLT